MIYYSSDFHGYHTNICYGVSKWEKKKNQCRKFDTLEEMNELLIKNINSKVKKGDTLYFNGDWTFGGIQNIWNFRKQIICDDIRFILGNHDHHIKRNKPLPNCKWDEDKKTIIDGEPTQSDEVVYAKDLFTSVNVLDIITYNKQQIVLCHYPLEEWENMDGGAWHLHGHCHGNLPKSKYKMMDVGIDTNNFNVYSFDDIKSIMDKRKIKPHHKKNSIFFWKK